LGKEKWFISNENEGIVNLLWKIFIFKHLILSFRYDQFADDTAWIAAFISEFGWTFDDNDKV
jgi:hypothetical protein